MPALYQIRYEDGYLGRGRGTLDDMMDELLYAREDAAAGVRWFINLTHGPAVAVEPVHGTEFRVRYADIDAAGEWHPYAPGLLEQYVSHCAWPVRGFELRSPGGER